MKLRFTVNRNLGEVFSCLTDMEKFVAVHPVIFKAQPLGDNHYKIYETLKFAGIPVSFKYRAHVSSNDNVVYIRAVVMGTVHIEMKFVLTDKNGKTEVEEEIHFKTVLPVKTMMRKIFATQHELMFRNMEQAVLSDLRV